MLGLAGFVIAIRRSGTEIGFSIAGIVINYVAVLIGVIWVLFFAAAVNITSDIAEEISGTSSDDAVIQDTAIVPTEPTVKVDPEKAYISNIELYDLDARYRMNFDECVIDVDFKLKNNGDRTLDKVKVMVYFKNASGTVIAEEHFYPVLVSYGCSKPLKPNYIWTQRKDRFFSPKSVPDEWEEGSVSEEIVNINFSHQGDT